MNFILFIAILSFTYLQTGMVDAAETVFPNQTTKIEKNCPKVDDTKFTYVLLSEIMPGQPYMSQEAMKLIASNDRNEARGYYTEEGNPRVKFCFDDHRSPFAKPMSVIKTPGDNAGLRPYLLTDSHHTIGGWLMAIKAIGGTTTNVTVPVTIVKDYSNLTPDMFWERVKNDGKVYTGGKQKLDIQDIEKVPDDSMRGFLEKTVVGCSEEKPIAYKDKNNSLWLRVGGKTRFANPDYTEFRISDTLKASRFSYKPGEEITPQKIARARQILASQEDELKKRGVKPLVPKGDHFVVAGTNQTPEAFCEMVKAEAARPVRPTQKR